MSNIEFIKKYTKKADINSFFEKALLPGNVETFVRNVYGTATQEEFLILIYLIVNEYLSISELDISKIEEYKELFENIKINHKRKSVLSLVRNIYTIKKPNIISYKNENNIIEDIEKNSELQDILETLGLSGDTSLNIANFFFRINEEQSGIEKYIRYISFLYNYNGGTPNKLKNDILFPEITDYKAASDAFKKALNIINTETINY